MPVRRWSTLQRYLSKPLQVVSACLVIIYTYHHSRKLYWKILWYCYKWQAQVTMPKAINECCFFVFMVILILSHKHCMFLHQCMNVANVCGATQNWQHMYGCCTIRNAWVVSESKKRHQDCLMSSAQSFYGPCLWSVAHLLVGMCPASTHPGMSSHMTQFYEAFPCVTTASDKHWGEKTWVRG